MGFFNRGPERGSQLRTQDIGKEGITIHTIPPQAVVYPKRSEYGWVTQSAVEADKLKNRMYDLREKVIVYRDGKFRTFGPGSSVKRVYYPGRTTQRTIDLSKSAA